MKSLEKKARKWGWIFGVLILLLAPEWGWAHGGEQHGEPSPMGGGTFGGPVKLSEEAKKNLGLETEEADLRTIETFVKCFGVVEPIPTQVQLVTTRISGRVLQVFANMGDAVEEGKLLAKMESRQIGDPPPQVEIKAPAAGVITEHHVFAGEPIEPDKVLFKIMNLAALYVKCHIYEADLAQIKLQQKVRVYVESFPGKSFEGVVEILGGQLEEETRTLPVWIRVGNPDSGLLPNMRAEGHLITGEVTNAVAVPRAAVLGDAGNYFVFLEKGEFYVRQPVVLGVRDDRYAEIKEGLLPGDRAVTQGNYQLQFAPAYSGETGTAKEKDGHEGRTGNPFLSGPSALLEIFEKFMHGKD